MIERLSGEYNRGYTKAIQDIIEIFDYVNTDLNYHHARYNIKNIKLLLKCILENRESIREHRKGFIRYNHNIKDFEWFKEK